MHALIVLFVAAASAIYIDSPSGITGYYESWPVVVCGPLAPPQGLTARLVKPHPQDPYLCGTMPVTVDYQGAIVVAPVGPCGDNEKAITGKRYNASAVIELYPLGTPITPYDQDDIYVLNGGIDLDLTVIPMYVVTPDQFKDVTDALDRNETIYGTLKSSPLVASQRSALIDIVKTLDITGNWRDLNPLLKKLVSGDKSAATDPCLTPYRDVSILCDMKGNIFILQTPGIIPIVNMGGTLSSSIGELTELRTLTLPSTGLTGIIPDFFRSTPYLRNIHLDSNSLSGSIPPSISSLSTINSFTCASNSLSGTIPFIHSTLRIFKIDHNEFSGPLPDFIFSPPLLVHVGVSNNAFTGGIPPLSRSPIWTVLDVSSNNLTGSIAPNQLSVGAFTSVSLAGNRFTGELPLDLFNVSSILDVSSNRFTSVPSTISTSTLQSLDISDNPIYGNIPNLISTTLQLTKFVAKNCGFVAMNNSQGFPAYYLTNVALTYLDLSDNPLDTPIDGVFYAVIANTVLTLKLSNCQIRGPIYNLGSSGITSMQYMDLSHNFITGYLSLPFFIDTLSYFDISHNNISGVVDLSFASATSLYYFDISDNLYMEGPLPTFMTTDYDVLSDHPDQNMFCPSIIGKYKKLSVGMSPTYYDYALCLCYVGYYRRDGVCVKCPEHSACPGGFNQSQVIPNPGYFPIPSIDTPTMMIKCPNASLTSNPCNPSGTFPFTCQTGYEGRMCSKCSHGYFSDDFECNACGSPLSILAGICIIISAALLFIWVSLVEISSWHRGTTTILVFYVQTTGYLLSNGFLPISDGSNLLSAVYNTVFFRLMSFECISKSFGHKDKFYIVFATPLVVGGILLLVNLIVRSIARIRDKGIRFHRWSLRFFLYVFKLIHFPVCSQIFATFNCIADPISGEKFLNSSPFVSCDAGDYKPVLVLASFGILIYVVITFAAFIFCLKVWGPHSDRGDWLREEFGLLYLCYRRDRYWGDVYLMARRLILAMIAALLPAESAALSGLLLIVMLLSLLGQLWLQVYQHRMDNNLESVSLSLITISYIMVVLISRIGFGQDGDLAIKCVLLVINAIFIIVCLGIITYNRLIKIGYFHRLLQRTFIVRLMDDSQQKKKYKKMVEELDEDDFDLLYAVIHSRKIKMKTVSDISLEVTS
ncbi:leucine-rich repeat-containing protein [Planoprotostelium fungivorum]|uniref:Leucine-rich repeat-containing protein n=1 Tax=Planoprotostelium fungivorum TaxID=1890364 RepID=A0A2P6NJT0_9EUKA|nr:leucine-rich repeat-containing protein [Planoprotostelium fungivorum]